MRTSIYKIEITVEEFKGSSTLSHTVKARLNLNTEHAMTDTMLFIDNFKEIEKIYKSAVRKNLWIEYSLSKADYVDDNVMDNFDYWSNCGYPSTAGFTKDDLYFRPDTKYTSEYKDLNINFKDGIITALAYAGL